MRTADVEFEPVDHVMAGFPVGQVNVSGEMASEPAALRESNTVRLSDLLLLTKEVDDSVRPLSCEADDSQVGQLTSLSWNVEPHR